MSMNNYDFEDTFEDEPADDAPEESNNRTFLIAAGGLGLLVLVALICLGAYVFLNTNTTQANDATAQAQAGIQEATVEAALTQTAIAQAQTQTVEATLTTAATNTPVIAEATTTPTETPNPATATVGAAFTQIAFSTQTIIPTSTALPNTGFADDVGIPGMFAMTLGLVILIFLARRLRTAPAR